MPITLTRTGCTAARSSQTFAAHAARAGVGRRRDHHPGGGGDANRQRVVGTLELQRERCRQRARGDCRRDQRLPGAHVEQVSQVDEERDRRQDQHRIDSGADVLVQGRRHEPEEPAPLQASPQRQRRQRQRQRGVGFRVDRQPAGPQRQGQREPARDEVRAGGRSDLLVDIARGRAERTVLGRARARGLEFHLVDVGEAIEPGPARVVPAQQVGDQEVAAAALAEFQRVALAAFGRPPPTADVRSGGRVATGARRDSRDRRAPGSSGLETRTAPATPRHQQR